MRDAAARGYFALCLGLGRLLRAARYARVALVDVDGEPRVRKARAWYAPVLVAMGGPLVRVLDTGVRVLPQRAWAARERLLYRRLHGSAIGVEGDGALLLPRLAGEPLATLLADARLPEAARTRALALSAAALRALHGLGVTHGDAMAENVMVDLQAGAAHWFDFETVHDPARPPTWQRADDVRALLATCLARTAPGRRAATLRLILDAYGDEQVTRTLQAAFASALRRPLAFHLGQAPLSWQAFREIGRLLGERCGEERGR